MNHIHTKEENKIIDNFDNNKFISILTDKILIEYQKIAKNQLKKYRNTYFR